MNALVLLLSATASASPPPNLLLVTIDTLRADHLRAYGHPSIDTPATDRLAREGVQVDDATVQAPQTRPSHGSILTGRYPWETGVRDNFSPPLAADVPTLATILRGHGYATGAFVASYVLTAESGLDRGFQVYDEPFSDTRPGSKLGTRPERPAGDVVDAADSWLGRRESGPFFAWVHFYDPHTPYNPPAPFNKRYADDPYAGEVAYADAQLGRLLESLDRRGLRKSTLVVVTSDHGEGLGDHGEDEHVLFLYDSTTRVPLLFSWPGVVPVGVRVGGQFRSIDLLPTMLGLMGLPPVAATGVSRAEAIRGGKRLQDNESAAEALFGALHFGYAPVRALRAEGWKFIDSPKAELYNLRDDPAEENNLIELRSQVAARMGDRLRTYDTAARGKPTVQLPTDAGALERLAALGYVSGPVPLGGSASGEDPKDKIEEFQSFQRTVHRATNLFGMGDYDRALAVLLPLARSKFASLEVQMLLGQCLLRKRRYADAAHALENAAAILSRFDQVYLDLSEAYLGLNKVDLALKAVERGLRLDPGSAVLQGEKGVVLHRSGDLAAARPLLEKARTLAPRASRVRMELAALYRGQGQTEMAVAELREAVRLDPETARAWSTLGDLLVDQGRREEAAAAYESARRANPADTSVMFTVAKFYLRDDPAKALSLLQRLVAIEPGHPGVTEALNAARQAVAAAAPAMPTRQP